MTEIMKAVPGSLGRNAFKIEWRGQLRRCTYEGELDIWRLESCLEQMLAKPAAELEVSCLDRDGDELLLGSDEELRLALDDFKELNCVPRFFVENAKGKVGRPLRYTHGSESDLNVAKPEPVTQQQPAANVPKRRPNGPRGCRGSGRSKKKA